MVCAVGLNVKATCLQKTNKIQGKQDLMACYGMEWYDLVCMCIGSIIIIIIVHRHRVLSTQIKCNVFGNQRKKLTLQTKN